MANNDHSLSILWNTIVHRIEELILDDVAEIAKCFGNLIEIPAVAIKDAAHVFKKPDFRLEAGDGGYESGKTISCVFQSKLMSVDAERLARRASDDHASSRQRRFRCKRRLFAAAFKIAPVGRATVSILFEADGGKPLRFKAKAQASTAGEQVHDQWIAALFGSKSVIQCF